MSLCQQKPQRLRSDLQFHHIMVLKLILLQLQRVHSIYPDSPKILYRTIRPRVVQVSSGNVVAIDLVKKTFYERLHYE